MIGPLRRAVATALWTGIITQRFPRPTYAPIRPHQGHHPEEGGQLILARRPQAAKGLVLRAEVLVDSVENREGLPIEHTKERSVTHDDFKLLPAHPLSHTQPMNGLAKLPVSLGGREEAPFLARELEAERGELFGQPLHSVAV